MLIKKHDFGSIEAYRLLNENSGEFVEIITGFGSVINKFMVKAGNALHSIIDGFENEDDLKNNYLKVFKGAKLFPFANRIRNGRYEFEGKEYQLDVNFPRENNAIHGLLLDKIFNVVKRDVNHINATLGAEYNYQGDENGFPFSFNLRINYVFNNENNFELETIIENTGNDLFPFVDGWHPYFTFNNQIDDIQFELPSGHVLEVDEQMIPNSRLIEYDRFNKIKKICPTNFDNCFKVKDTEDIVTTKLVNLFDSTGIEIWQEAGLNKYNYIQVYIPPLRKSIAIEPMTAPPDAFNSKTDIIVLQPSETRILRCGIKFLKLPRRKRTGYLTKC